MGISLQQYRAAIGNWQVRRKRTTSMQSQSSKTQENLCTTIIKEGIYQNGQGKLHTALLCGLVIALSIISQVIYSSSVADIKDISHPISTGTTKDFAAATGNLIPYQCHQALLVMAGVEQNPGPVTGIEAEDETFNKQEDIIAELCSDAPNTEIRDCIRLYKPKNSVRQHKNEFTKCQKQVLVNTLEYLNITGQDQFNKPTCINTLICRIQNLLPDKCNLCEAEYCVKRDETPLLSCEICGQGSHNVCLWDHFGVSPDDREQFDSEQAMGKLNPTGLPGLHYLCGACEDTAIPDKEAGLLKRKSTASADTADSQPPQSENHPETPEEETETETENVVIPEQLPSPALQTSVDEEANTSQLQTQTQSQQQSQTSNQSSNQSTAVNTICSFYRQGTCRFGAAGRGCPKDHPRPCKKLIQHGNKGPNGCTLGRARCDNFHPKMCHTSLTRGYCYEADCQSRHVTGTKRELSVTNNTGQKRQKDTRNNTTNKTDKADNKTSDSGDFLGVLHRLKVDMLEAMDTKIAQYISAQSSTPTPTGLNYTRTAIPRMNLAETVPLVNNGHQGHLHPLPMQTAQQWGMGIPGQPVYLQSGMNPVSPMYMPFRLGNFSH